MYTYNKEAATKSESSRITQSGKYKGIFFAAYKVEPNEKGTIGIEFAFKSDDGQTAEGLRLYTVNGKGEHIYGFNILMAIMGCMKVPAVTEAQGSVELWDNELKQKKAVPKILYPELIRKPIGLILQREEYKSAHSAEPKSRMVIVMPFTHDTELTIVEMQQGKTKGTSVDAKLATLKDKLVPRTGSPSGYSSTPPEWDKESFSDVAPTDDGVVW